jgi:hypothetical protein
MKIEPFSPAIHLFKATRSSSSYTYQSQDVLASLDSVKQAIGLESGAFTPVASNVTNNGTVSITSGTYTRVGDVVTMTFTMDVQMDVAEFTTNFNISIPIASDFTSKYQVNGVAYGNTNALANVVIQGDQSNNLPFITVDSINIGDAVQFIGVMLQYQII